MNPSCGLPRTPGSFQRLNRESTERLTVQAASAGVPCSFQRLNRESTESGGCRTSECPCRCSFQRLNRESTESFIAVAVHPANRCSFQRLNRESTEGAASCASVWTHLIFPVSWSSNGGQPYGAAAATKWERGTGRIQRVMFEARPGAGTRGRWRRRCSDSCGRQGRSAGHRRRLGR